MMWNKDFKLTPRWKISVALGSQFIVGGSWHNWDCHSEKFRIGSLFLGPLVFQIQNGDLA